MAWHFHPLSIAFIYGFPSNNNVTRVLLVCFQEIKKCLRKFARFSQRKMTNNSQFVSFNGHCKFVHLHKLIITILKVKPDKLPPRIIKYRDYKNFESNAFNNKLQISLKNFDMNNSSFIELKTIFMELLNKVVPQKTKYLRASYSKFMTKELSKAIMLRTKLRNQFLKTRTSEAKLKYNKQRNLCVSLLRKTKRNDYENLNLNDISDNKKFWSETSLLQQNKTCGKYYAR